MKIPSKSTYFTWRQVEQRQRRQDTYSERTADSYRPDEMERRAIAAYNPLRPKLPPRDHRDKQGPPGTTDSKPRIENKPRIDGSAGRPTSDTAPEGLRPPSLDMMGRSIFGKLKIWLAQPEIDFDNTYAQAARSRTRDAWDRWLKGNKTPIQDNGTDNPTTQHGADTAVSLPQEEEDTERSTSPRARGKAQVQLEARVNTSSCTEDDSKAEREAYTPGPTDGHKSNRTNGTSRSPTVVEKKQDHLNKEDQDRRRRIMQSLHRRKPKDHLKKKQDYNCYADRIQEDRIQDQILSSKDQVHDTQKNNDNLYWMMQTTSNKTEITFIVKEKAKCREPAHRKTIWLDSRR